MSISLDPQTTKTESILIHVELFPTLHLHIVILSDYIKFNCHINVTNFLALFFALSLQSKIINSHWNNNPVSTERVLNSYPISKLNQATK